MIDLSTWLTTAQVCERLGITERTLERQKAQWQTYLRQRPGKRAERVYDPQQVEDRAPKPHTELVHNGPIAPLAPPLPTIPTSAPELPPLTQFDAWSVIAPRLLEAMVAAKPAAPALFCTLKEAAKTTGLSVTCLRRMIADGRLPSIRDGATKVRRGDLLSIEAEEMARGDSA